MTPPDSFRARVASLWHRLTEPNPAVVEPGERAWVGLLLNVLLTLMVVTVAYGFWHVIGILRMARPTLDRETGFILGGLVFLALAYASARTPRYRSAAAIFVVASTLIMYVGIAATPESRLDAVWLLFGPLACSLFFPPRATISLLVVICLSVLLLPRLGSAPSGYRIAESEIFLIFFGLLVIIVAVVHKQDRRRLEANDSALVEHAASLRRSEARYRAMFEANPNPMFVFDEETLRFLSVNDAAVAHYGYSRDEFLSMTVGDFRPPEDMQHLQAAIAEAKENPGVDLVEARHRKRDGTLIDVEITSHLLDADGRRARLVMPYDITERKRADAALRRSAERYENVTNSAMDAFWAADLDGQILEANQASLELYGYSREEMLTLHIADLDIDESLEVVQEHQRRIAEKGEDRFEACHRRKDGTILEVEVSARVWAPEGPTGWFIRDVTARNRAEKERLELERRLLQAQKMEAIGQLAGGIAHDFNNLLTPMIGSCEFLLAGWGTGAARIADVEVIRSAANRAASLTRQLLAFARRQPLQPRVLDVNDVLATMGSLLARVLGEDVSLELRPAPDLWPVEADPGQLEQVVLNLAVNAHDAMPHGGNLTIETSNVLLDEAHAALYMGAKSGPHVMLAVTDTGHGMTPATLAHVFDPFFTTKEQGKGTGLGLSTVYGIVKQSGGSIWAYSEPGEGTTLKIYLPRVEKPRDWSPAQEPSPAMPMCRGEATILVVEDEPTVRRLTARVLEEHGYEVLTAGSPDEAIALYDLRTIRIDLVLTDVVLPGMSGRAMVDLLVARLEVAPRILYMSGYTQNAIVHDGRLDAGVAFLEKPFTPDALLRKVQKVLDAPLDGQMTL